MPELSGRRRRATRAGRWTLILLPVLVTAPGNKDPLPASAAISTSPHLGEPIKVHVGRTRQAPEV